MSGPIVSSMAVPTPTHYSPTPYHDLVHFNPLSISGAFSGDVVLATSLPVFVILLFLGNELLQREIQRRKCRRIVVELSYIPTPTKNGVTPTYLLRLAHDW